MHPTLRTILFALPPELITNGGFDADANWTKGTGWSIGAGVATKVAGTGSSLGNTSFVAAVGRTYTCTYTLTVAAGAVQPFIGAATGGTRTADGTYTDIITAAAATTYGIFANASFAGTVDNVSIRQRS